MFVPLYSKQYSFLSVDQISDSLWLGNVSASLDLEFLNRNRITRILACGTEFEDRTPLIPRVQLSIQDNTWDPTSTESEFRRGAKQLGEWLDAGERVLVHCMGGISRSTTTVLLDMMLRQKKTLVQAVESVYHKRRKVSPITDYWLFLLRVDEELREKNAKLREEQDRIDKKELVARFLHSFDDGAKSFRQNSILSQPPKDTSK